MKNSERLLEWWKRESFKHALIVVPIYSHAGPWINAIKKDKRFSLVSLRSPDSMRGRRAEKAFVYESCRFDPRYSEIMATCLMPCLIADGGSGEVEVFSNFEEILAR